MTDPDILERASGILAGLLAEDGFNLSNPNTLVLHAAIRLRAERREVLLGYWFGHGNRLIGVEELATGTETTTYFSPDEVARRAVMAGARVAVMVHNHIAEVTVTPSDTDKTVARELSQRFAVLGILALHFVVSPTGGVNVLTGDRCTFKTETATPSAALCPRCGSQALPSQTQEPT